MSFILRLPGQLVVGNEYATAMVEENMDKGGFENDIAGCSCVTKGCSNAIQMLKNQMMGVNVNPAPKKWNNDVIDGNKLLPETVPESNAALAMVEYLINPVKIKYCPDIYDGKRSKYIWNGRLGVIKVPADLPEVRITTAGSQAGILFQLYTGS